MGKVKYIKGVPPKSYTYDYVGEIEEGSVYIVVPKRLSRGGGFVYVIKDNETVAIYCGLEASLFIDEKFPTIEGK